MIDGIEDRVARHYARDNLEETILVALVASGNNPDRLTTGDLAPVDEFPQGTAEDEVTSQFYFPAVSSLQERRLRALKHGDSFALFNHYGDIVPFRGAPDGLYHCDTRYLSHLELRLNGQQPLLLSSTVHDDNAVFAADLTNPDLFGKPPLLA